MLGEMMNSFEIINETNSNIDELNEIENVLNYALKHLKLENCVFNIIIVNKDVIHKLNKDYRGIDRVTDVISFALEDDETFNSGDIRILGDIYICLEKALEQASEYGHSKLRELSFLSIHGLLHLLGYDHMNEEDEKVMFSLQDEILNGYGVIR